MLYPNHEAYVTAVRRNVADLVEKRFIVREDGDTLIHQAQMARVP
jgi:hypothetical protein